MPTLGLGIRCPSGHAPDSAHSLTLEWNNLGMWEDAFATFCGALAANSALRQLDLRNNQITHKGAEELALALKMNSSLKELGEASLPAATFSTPRARVLLVRGVELLLVIISGRRCPGPGQGPGNVQSGDGRFPSRSALE